MGLKSEKKNCSYTRINDSTCASFHYSSPTSRNEARRRLLGKKEEEATRKKKKKKSGKTRIERKRGKGEVAADTLDASGAAEVSLSLSRIEAMPLGPLTLSSVRASPTLILHFPYLPFAGERERERERATRAFNRPLFPSSLRCCCSHLCMQRLLSFSPSLSLVYSEMY